MAVPFDPATCGPGRGGPRCEGVCNQGQRSRSNTVFPQRASLVLRSRSMRRTIKAGVVTAVGRATSLSARPLLHFPRVPPTVDGGCGIAEREAQLGCMTSREETLTRFTFEE